MADTPHEDAPTLQSIPENDVSPDGQEPAQPASSYELLQEKIAQATSLSAKKSYSEAAEIFSEALEVQAELQGEMNPMNADLLYSYGRCLYHLAVSKSDVLGGKVAGPAGEQSGTSGEQRGTKRKAAGDSGEGSSKAAEVKMEGKKVGAGADGENKPFFQIEGDDDAWASSSDEENEEGEDAEAQNDVAEIQEEEDDFATAYEILDMARVLLQHRISDVEAEDSTTATAQADSENPPSTQNLPQTKAPKLRELKEKLSETHDALSEISLENERFTDAISDSTSSLALKTELYPFSSSIVAEAHFKVSLALEFASVTQNKDPNTKTGNGTTNQEEVEETTQQVDEKMRQESAKHMAQAISSTRLRLQDEETQLNQKTSQQISSPETQTSPSPREITKTTEDLKTSIKDAKEVLIEMETRLADLKTPMVGDGALKDLLESSILGLGGKGGNKGLGEDLELRGRDLSSVSGLGGDGVEGVANDLSGLVRKKDKKKSIPPSAATAANTSATSADGNNNGKAKRKLDDQDNNTEKEEKEKRSESPNKKAKV